MAKYTSDNKRLYLRAQALSWEASGAKASTQFSNDSAHKLVAVMETLSQPVIISWRNIGSLAQYALAPIAEFLKRSPRMMAWVDIGEHLRGGMLVHLQDIPHDVKPDQILFGSMANESVSDIREAMVASEDFYLREVVAKSYREYGDKRRMASTPLLTEGEFDARSIIGNPEDFALVALLLAERLSSVMSGYTDVRRDIRLLAASLRAAPFAAACAELVGGRTPMELVDHLGPQQRVVEEHWLHRQDTQAEYIYIGDFIIAGTEVRVAEAYVRSKQSVLRNAVVIAGLLRDGDYRSGVKVTSLTNLYDCKPGIKYDLI